MADEERKRIYDAYVAYSTSWISIWVVPFLCTDDEQLARHYLPYLLEGDPKEPTELVIQEHLPESTPENPVIQQRVLFREAAPKGMGTPPAAWVQLLILNAENGHRASERALELAHTVYLETNRESPRSLSLWSARRLKNPSAPRRSPTSERDRRIGWLLQLLYVPGWMAMEHGLSSRRLSIRRKQERVRDLSIYDAVAEAWNSVPDLPSITYDGVAAAWKHTKKKHRARPDLLAKTGVDPVRLAEVGRRYVRSIGGASDALQSSGE